MARDFRAKQIRTFAIIGSGSSDISANSPELRLAFYPHEMALNSNGGTQPKFNLGDATVGEDVWCIFGKKTGLGPRANVPGDEADTGFPNPDFPTPAGSARPDGSTVLFTGNVVISGSLYAERQIIEVDNTVNGDFLTPPLSSHKLAGGFGSAGGGVDIDNNGDIKTDGFVRTGTVKNVGANLGVQTETGGNVVISSAANVTIDSVDGGSINMGTSTAAASDTSPINIGTSPTARTITVGNDASTKVDINALDVEVDVGSGGFTVNSAGAIDITSSSGNANITIDPHGSGTLTLGSDDNTKVDVNALTIELDAASKIIANAASTDADAVSIVSAGGVDITASGNNGSINIAATEASDFTLTSNAAGEDLTVALAGATDSSLVLSSTGTGSDALQITTSAGGMDITSAAAMDITTSAGNSNITIAQNGTGVLELGTMNGRCNVRAHYLDMDANDGFNIDGRNNSYVQTTTAGRDMVVRANGGGDQHLQLTSAGTSADAIKLHASAGGLVVNSAKAITMDATTEDINIIAEAADAKVVLRGDNTSGVAIHLDGNAANGSIVDIDGGQIDIDANTTATITAPTSLGLDSSGAILMRDTGIHLGPAGTGGGMAALTAGNSPIRIFKATGNVYNADPLNSSEVNYPFNGDGASGAGVDNSVIAEAGDLVVSNRSTVNGTSGIAEGKIIFDGAVNFSTINTNGNMIIGGNLTVNGTTTTLNTAQLAVEDPLIILAKDQSGGPQWDAGFVVERGTSINTAFIWDESAVRFNAITTADTGSTAGNVSISGYVPISAQTFMLETPNNKIDLDTDVVITAAADITLAAGGANVKPNAHNTIALGVLGRAWSDLYLGSGAVINFNNSDVTMTHSSNLLTIAGGNTRVSKLELQDADNFITQTGNGVEVQSDTSIQLDAPIVDFEDDGVVLQFGDDDDVTLTHVHDAGILLNTGMQLQFGEAGENISGDNTDLTIASGGDINLNATADINLPANVGLTFGDDGEKIEGNGSGMTISGGTVKIENDSAGASATKVMFGGDGGSYIERTAGGGNPAGNGSLTMVSNRPMLFDSGGAFTVYAGSVNIKDVSGSNPLFNIGVDGSNNTKLWAHRTNADLLLQVSPGGSETEVMRLDASESSLLMAGQNKIQFNDANKYIHYDGTDLTLVSNSDIKLDPDGNDVTIVDANAQLNFNASSLRIFKDGDDLKFDDITNTGAAVALSELKANAATDAGGWRWVTNHNSKNRARSDHDVLFYYGNTDGNMWMDDESRSSRYHFYVKSDVAAVDQIGFESHLDLKKTLSLRDTANADKEAILSQDGDFTRFGHFAGNSNATAPASRTVSKIMALKPGSAGVGGLFLEQNQSLFFSNNAADASLNIRRQTNRDVEAQSGIDVIQIQGNILPQADNTFNLGTSAYRFANLYTGDLHLSNIGSSNDVDGTSGNWTIQEGEDNLYVINNLTGKKFKMMLQPVEDGE